MWHAWERRVYRVLVGKPEGKRPLGRSKHRWEDGIRMDLTIRLAGGGVLNGSIWLRIGAGSGALVNAVMNLQALLPRS
jgi:hypothetical protein